MATPTTDERLKWLLEASPNELDAFDRLRDRAIEKEESSLRLFRMGQAAAKTGISRSSLWRAIRDGRIRTVEIRRGSRRIAESELRRFVEGRDL